MNLEKLERGDLQLMHIAVYQHIRHMEEWIEEYSKLDKEEDDYTTLIKMEKAKKKRMENLAIRLRKAIRKVGDSRDICYI